MLTFDKVAKVLAAWLWMVTVLVWPLLKWIISIEVFYQFIKMVYHWDTPGTHAGLVFLIHFSLLVALTYYVSIFRPGLAGKK